MTNWIANGMADGMADSMADGMANGLATGRCDKGENNDCKPANLDSRIPNSQPRLCLI